MDSDSEKPLDIRRDALALAAVGRVPGAETLLAPISSFDALRAIAVAEFGCGVTGRVSADGRARMLARSRRGTVPTRFVRVTELPPRGEGSK